MTHFRRKSSRFDFQRSCKCLTHGIWSADTNTKFSELSAYKIVGGKKFKENKIQKLRDEKLLSSRANHLCTLCYKEFIRRFLPHANIIHEEAPPNATPNVHDDVVEEDFTNVTQNLDILPNAVQQEEAPRNPTPNVEVLLTQLINILEKEHFDVLYPGNVDLWGTLIELIGECFCRKPIFDDNLVIQSKSH